MRKRYVIILVLVFSGLTAAALLLTAGKNSLPGDNLNNSSIFTVSKSDLTISVTENGDIMALSTYDIKSEVEGRNTIVTLVDEGTVITPEDVNEMVLVELDSSEIEERLTQQKISYLSAEASLTEAKESFEIQKKQNQSDIQSQEMAVRFAIMDLKKYIGEQLAADLIKKEAHSNYKSTDIAELVQDESLGGDALQKLRELNDNITLADMKYARAEDKLEGTKKLFKKQYVAETELRGDELEVESLKIQKESARTALRLYEQYEFPKETERLLNDLSEAILELEKIKAQARSKLAQAEAKKASCEAKYDLQKSNLEKYKKQLDACVIKAPAPGEVVYSSSTSRRRSRDPIEVGVEVNYRQELISIPDPSKMKIELKIHEAWIDKILPGQKAKISVAAFAGEEFDGTVLKKAPLADPPNWHNPDLKVYTTEVVIDENSKTLKTGMTAKVEIIIEQLEDVYSVPIQSVINIDGKKYCYVSDGGKVVRREVQTGSFNDDFVEIKQGLSEGDKVLLSPDKPR